MTQTEFTTTKTAKTWSPLQTAIYDNFANGTGHLKVEALAGTGKTTTIVEAAKRIPEGLSTLLCAFNKSIETELKARAPRGVEVKTLHGVGFALIRRRFRTVRVNDEKKATMAEQALTEVLPERMRYDARRKETRPTWTDVNKVAKLAALGKNLLVEDMPGLTMAAIDYSIEDEEFPAGLLAEAAARAIELAAEKTDEIDFDDMVWFPAKFGLASHRYDVVVVDEAQDMNAAQLSLARGEVRENGRIIIVGDSRQAIYGFRGSHASGMDEMAKTLGAAVLPLSITYRCPKKVVAIAQQIVPQYRAADEAPEGLVEQVSYQRFEALAKPGDFVLGRANAPLVSGCLGFLRRGIPACIQGRDIGKTLLGLIDKSGAQDLADLESWLRAYESRERERALRLNKEARADLVSDQVEAILAIAEGEPTVEAVRRKLESLFRDDDATTKVVFSTVHKAKGLERDRVFLLTSTFRPSRSTEEANIWYVAVTRAKQELYLVSA